ncbi:efflux RND transporter periplasmic adaptor subunit [Telmatospirillum siberiense]|uniref:Efflux RND transporter periplasmic adaptor subunit n=1 Tax=Telmatospirillum siberiense TaxID=382514 RepID=A0A2N3PX75_9PROT|nr:efflux RND transporter periplasmic adaptor subunit [Telmatospirillum siberiense]PKU25013.1 efflux RND transporter periplasmic adaptor subunit [Telmatospirillum siberiense]
MRKKYLIWIVLLLAVAGSLWAVFRPGADTPRTASAPGAAGAAVPVTAVRSSRQDVAVYLTGLGNVQAFNTVTIRPQVDGQLLRIAFKEGQEVRTGELLAQIDSRSYQASLDQAQAKKAQDEAQLANARADLTRYTGLVEKNYVSRQQLDTSQALVKQLQAQVQGDTAAIENAQVLLGYTNIKTPIDGRAGIRQVDVGNIVHANDANGIVVITQVHPISVLFTLPESAVSRVAAAMAGEPLKVTALSRDGKMVLDEGILQLVDNQIDQTTATVRLKATLPNKKGLLWPGQFVNAKLRVATLPQVVTVPAQAVQRGPKGAFAFVVKDEGTVEMRTLQVGEISEGVAVIERGIGEGETVVVEGQYRLQPGTRVEAKVAAADSLPSVVKPE